MHMESLEDIKRILSEERPAPWNALPDIDLYMDQVLGYMHRQLDSHMEPNISAAMINNYIREGLLPRTKGKKYNRGHLARLTTICVMKQVLQVGDISLLFQMFPSDIIEQIYEEYREVLDSELTSVAEGIPDDDETLVLADAIVRFAVASYANKAAAELLIGMVKENNSKEKNKGAKK